LSGCISLHTKRQILFVFLYMIRQPLNSPLFPYTTLFRSHFIGMLAFRLPVAQYYDVPLTLLSGLPAVLASALALFVASRPTLGVPRLLAAGLLMGMGILTMHYTGMEAMRMQPPIRYEPSLAVLSVVIAVSASIVALWS